MFIYAYQRFIGFPFWNRAIDMGGIANFHTVFNIISTIILFPFIGWLEKLTIFTIKDKTFDGFDPENGNSVGHYTNWGDDFPTPRILLIGTNLTF